MFPDHYHNPRATGVFRDLAHLPRWVCYLQAAAAETRPTFIAQKQTHSLFPTPFPKLETSKGQTHLDSQRLAPLASRGRKFPVAPGQAGSQESLGGERQQEGLKAEILAFINNPQGGVQV